MNAPVPAPLADLARHIDAAHAAATGAARTAIEHAIASGRLLIEALPDDKIAKSVPAGEVWATVIMNGGLKSQKGRRS